MTQSPSSQLDKYRGADAKATHRRIYVYLHLHVAQYKSLVDISRHSILQYVRYGVFFTISNGLRNVRFESVSKSSVVLGQRTVSCPICLKSTTSMRFGTNKNVHKITSKI